MFKASKVKRWAIISLVFALFTLLECALDENVSPLTAPDLSDLNARTYVTNEPIEEQIFTNNGGCMLSNCTSDPTLPDGLSVEISGDKMTCVLKGIPIKEAAGGTYAITATNAEGSDTAMVQITINEYLPAPEMSDLSEQTYAEDMDIGRKIFINSGGGKLSNCTSDLPFPNGLSVTTSNDKTTCILQGTPQTLTEKNTYTITATNAEGSDTATVDISVTPPLRVEMGDLSPQFYQQNIAIAERYFPSRGLSKIKPDDNSDSTKSGCRIEPALPAGLEIRRRSVTLGIDTCALRGTPTEEAASREYYVVVEEVNGKITNKAARVNITITKGPPPPSLDDLSARSYTIKEPIQQPFTNNGGKGSTSNPLTCVSDPSLPTGLSVAADSGNTTCILKGTPTVVTRRKLYTITVTNEAGSNTATVWITITPPSLIAPYVSATNGGCNTTVRFSDISTIIASYRCTRCHTGASTSGAGYSLTNRGNAMKSGSDSTQNVIAGNPWASFLFVKVWGSNNAPPNVTNPPKGSNAVRFSKNRMPTKCKGNKCIDTDQAHVNAFFCWIAQGAK